ncbi:chemotaxis protein CheA, partial [Paraburkholderia sp. SIMBA_027]
AVATASAAAPAVQAVQAAPIEPPAAVQGGTPPEHVVDQAVQAAGEWTDGEPAQTGQAAGTGDANESAGPHLKITLRGVDEKDQELLAEELGNLGNIVGRVK